MKIYIGRFNEDDIANNKDKIAVENEQTRTGLEYTLTKLITKNGKITAIDIWLCDFETAFAKEL